MPTSSDFLQKFVYRFAWIIPGEVARCSQWYVDWKQEDLLEQGIKSIINLRGYNPKKWWWKRETAFADKHDIARYEATMDSRKLPTRQMLLDLVQALEDTPRPFLLKCAGGQDRTGFSATLYLIQRDGWSVRDAVADAQFHFWPGPQPKKRQRWARLFFDYAAEESKGRPIAEWIRSSYKPEPFRDWLNLNGHRRTFKGIHKQ